MSPPEQRRSWDAEAASGIDAVIDQAHQVLAPEDWDHLVAGAGTEVTLRRNREAFSRIALRPRLLADVDRGDAATSVVGEPLDLPVMLAPVGSIARYHPEGAAAAASAAHAAGTLAFISCFALPTLEEVRARTAARFVSQIYLRGTRDEVLSEVRRAEALGCPAVCLTADLAAPGRRDREAYGGLGRPAAPGTSQPKLDAVFAATSLRWSDVEMVRAASSLPLILKGVTSAEDARICLECGVDAVYVSNHGGRLVDHVPSTIEVLPEIVRAVEGRAEVIVDSGFVRGSDVVKALACGARAVLIGKLLAWALAAGGCATLVQVLRRLREEVCETMAHLGARTVDAIGADALRPSFAPQASDWIGFAPGAD